jgi:hypothetical protein
MTLEKRIKTWQDAAKHHSLPYYGIAIVIEPFLVQKDLKVTRTHCFHTWFETPLNNHIEMIYRRSAKFKGKRIEIRVNGDQPVYFGPRDVAAIKELLTPL